MKKIKLLTFSLGAILGITACGSGVTHVVDQNLSDKLPSSEVEIQFWHCLGQEKTKNLNKIIDAFNIKYAGSFKLVASVPGGSTYDGLHSLINARLASGKVPALAMGYPDSFSEYMGTKLDGSNILRIKNFIEDTRTISVNKIVRDSSGNWSVEKDASGNPVKEDLRLGFTDDEFNDFIEPYRLEGKGYQFDGYWSMPMYKSTEVMFYNLNYFCGDSDLNDAIFNEASSAVKDGYYDLKDEIASFKKYYGQNHDAYKAKLAELKAYCAANGGKVYEVPTTWDELFALSKTMRDDRNGKVDISDFIPVGYDSDANMIISQMAQRGIPYTTNENIESKGDHLLFNNDAAAKMLEEIKGYIDKMYLCTKYSLDVTGSTYTNDRFTAKTTVMSIGSTGGSDYQVSDNFAVEVAPVPYKGSTPKYIQQGPSICFFDNENVDINTGAWLFYKMLSDPDKNTALATENSYDPIRYSSEQSDSYKAFIANSKKALLNYVPTITHLPQVRDNQITSAVFVGSSTCRTQMAELILKMVHMEMSAEDALNEAYDAALNATKK